MLLDTLCVSSWKARPASFVGLMTLYESNFIRLRSLVRDIRGLTGELVSRVPDDCDLHLQVMEQSRYTSILRMTYLFEDVAGPVAEPDLEVRVYHDACVAEASQCAPRHRHAGLASIRSALSATVGERWLRNMMLNKWLEYCAERGHRFLPAGVVPAASLHEPVRRV